jgi:hypothetical protein
MVSTVATTSRTTACVIIKSRVVGSIDDTIDVKALALTVTPFPFPFPPPSTLLLLLLLLLFIQSDSFPRAEKQNDDDVVDDDDELLPLLDDKTNTASRSPPKRIKALAEKCILFRHT